MKFVINNLQKSDFKLTYYKYYEKDIFINLNNNL